METISIQVGADVARAFQSAQPKYPCLSGAEKSQKLDAQGIS
jgi:hypothetical protein